MSPRRRRCRVRRWRLPGRDLYVLRTWKLRAAFVVVGAGIGLWEAIIFRWPLSFGVVVGIAVALLMIWREARRHEPRD
jgi:membrane protein implicated in regulation of membrane protease activity